MYLNFYGLTHKPFHPTPNPWFLYESPAHREALASVLYAVEHRMGFMTVIGEVGVGKTTILRAFLEQFDSPNDDTIYIYNPMVSFTNLLTRMLTDLGVVAASRDDAQMIQQLQEILQAKYERGGTIVLLIDEAQNMPVHTLEQLRMLSNIETPQDKLLQIVLSGQPELEALLHQNALRQLRQRITVRATIGALSESESATYLAHRLAVAGAGAPQDIFSPAALNAIIKQSKGIPRELNTLADNTLLTGYAYQQRPIPVSTVKEVVADLHGHTAPRRPAWMLPTAAAAVILLAAVFWLQPTPSFNSTHSMEQARVQVSDQAVAHDTGSTEVAPISSSAASPADAPADPAPDNVSPSPPDTAVGAGPTDTPDASFIGPPETATAAMTEPGEHTTPSSQLAATRKPNLPSAPKRGTLTTSAGGATSSETSDDAVSNGTGESNEASSSKAPPPAAIFAQSSTASASTEVSAPSATTAEPRFHIIRRGDTLSNVIRRTYGRTSPQRVRWLLRHNPHIRSVRQLKPGQKIVLPTLWAKYTNDSPRSRGGTASTR